jgi:membrane protease subunit (stomatin/prohibitin family)
MMRDADFGAVRLRARGNFSYKVGDKAEMISRFVGSRDEFSVDGIEGQLRTRIISSFSDALGELKIPALDIVAQYDEIGAEMRRRLAAIFEDLGLDLLSFTLENISVPEAVQKALDERASMGAVGNLNNYAKFQAANAMRDAADNDSGMAGGMMGMMVGGQLGGMMGGAMQQNAQPAAASVTCPKCGAAVAAGAKFCGNCGADVTQPAGGVTCPKCGAAVVAGAKFCGNCGTPLSAACVKCGAELAPGSKFCSACGAAQS